VSNNTGTLIVGANCSRVYRGYQEGLWRLSCVSRVDVAGLDEAQAAARYRATGLRYIRHHVGDQPRIAAIRLLRTWGLWHPDAQVAYESLEGRPQRWEALGMHLDWLLVPLAAVGALLLRRRRD